MKLEISSEQVGGETATVHVDLIVYHCKDPNCYTCEYSDDGMEGGMECTECELGYKLEDGSCTELTYVRNLAYSSMSFLFSAMAVTAVTSMITSGVGSPTSGAFWALIH